MAKAFDIAGTGDVPAAPDELPKDSGFANGKITSLFSVYHSEFIQSTATLRAGTSSAGGFIQALLQPEQCLIITTTTNRPRSIVSGCFPCFGPFSIGIQSTTPAVARLSGAIGDSGCSRLSAWYPLHRLLPETVGTWS